MAHCCIIPSVPTLAQSHAARRLPVAIEPLLRQFKAQLCRRFGSRVREVTLFGSWARGSANENSDVDVLVVVDGLTGTERREIWDLAFQLDCEDSEPMWNLSPLCYATDDAAALRSRERRLMTEVAQQGIVV